VPGAFRPPEQIVAWAIRGDHPDPRIVEALPAVFAWNRWNEHLLTGCARADGANDRRAVPSGLAGRHRTDAVPRAGLSRRIRRSALAVALRGPHEAAP
jgi:hypothetical protein